LSVFNRSLELLLWIDEGPRDSRVQPLLVVSQRFVALLRQRLNQIADQGFHTTHGLHAGRAAETNFIECQPQKILPRWVRDNHPEGSFTISNGSDFQTPAAEPQQQVFNLV